MITPIPFPPNPYIFSINTFQLCQPHLLFFLYNLLSLRNAAHMCTFPQKHGKPTSGHNLKKE